MMFIKKIDTLKDEQVESEEVAAWLSGMDIGKSMKATISLPKKHLVPRQTNAYCESECMFVYTYH